MSVLGSAAVAAVSVRDARAARTSVATSTGRSCHQAIHGVLVGDLKLSKPGLIRRHPSSTDSVEDGALTRPSKRVSTAPYATKRF